MKTNRLSLAFAVLLWFALLAHFTASAQQDSARPAVPDSPPDGWQRAVLRITNPKGVYPFTDYTCGSFTQRVTRESEGAVTIQTQVPRQIPKPAQTYPLTAIPESAKPYLQPTARIQSDHPEIARAAQAILQSAHAQTEADVVQAVCTWTQRHMVWALPDEVPDALTCLRRKRGNCIGFSHLAGAILRHLGVPARTIRVFVALPNGGLTRHTLIEVYYPQDDLWVACDAMLGGRISGDMLFLYTDADWSVVGQRATRPFSIGPNTRVTFPSR